MGDSSSDINHSEQINPLKSKNYKQINLFPYKLKANVVIFIENPNFRKGMKMTKRYHSFRK
jgi:hypothetical protein